MTAVNKTGAPTLRRNCFFPSAAMLALALVACSGDVDVPGPTGGFVMPSAQPSAGSLQPSGVGIAGGEAGVVEGSAASSPSATPANPLGPSTPDQNPAAAAPQDPAASDAEGVIAYTPPTPEPAELLARTWKLTHEQYARSVESLVGVVPDLSQFVPDSAGNMFANYSSTGLVRVDLADNYFDTAKEIAAGLTEQQLTALTSCSDLSDACSAAFIEELGARAFRRPLNAGELAGYVELFDLGASEGEPLSGFRAVVQGLLNSPMFLYRTEIGPEASEASPTFLVTDYEVATLLSYSLLDSPPPQSLFDAAGRGELTNPATLETNIQALLALPEADEQLGQFITEWLEVTHFADVEKFPDVFPGFDDVRTAMEQETADFLATSATPTSTMANLLLDPVAASSPQLQQFYLSDPSAPATTNRVGVLGLGTVLAHHAKSYLTSPTLRGTFIRKRMFCQEITLPEGFTPPPLSETEVLGEAKTTRELYEQHQSDPTCAPCHRLTDNIGFSLEEFDGAGRFRTLDTTQGDSQPIDSTGMLTDSDVNRPISNHLDLAQAMSESELVRECMARQAFRFYFGRGETSRGQLPIIAGHAALQQSGQLGDMLAALMNTDSTTARSRE